MALGVGLPVLIILRLITSVVSVWIYRLVAGAMSGKKKINLMIGEKDYD